MLAGDVLESRIRSEGLVSPFRREAFRGSVHELLVGKVVDPRGTTFSLFEDAGAGAATDVFELKPREVVTIVSREIVRCPDDMTLLISLTRGLTDGGVLALDGGIVDPGYEGPLSVTVINLSASSRALSLKDSFGRVAFFGHDKVREPAGETFDHAEFVSHVKRRMLERSPAVYVDYDLLRKEAADAARAEVQRRFPTFVAGLGVFIASIVFLAIGALAFLVVLSQMRIL